MKVDITKKLIIYVTVILSCIDDDAVKNYIYEASVMEIINSLCTYE